MKHQFTSERSLQTMKTTIHQNLDQPAQLEKIFREDQATFNLAFKELFSDIAQHPAAQFWQERLNYGKGTSSPGNARELIYIAAAVFIAGLIAKIPEMAGISHDHFYPRNLSFVVFPLLMAYFAWKRQLPVEQVFRITIAILIPTIYINILPYDALTDTLILACIHLPFLLWLVLGYTFAGPDQRNYKKWIAYLRYNADLAVMSALVVIAGGIFTAVNFGLFSLIDIDLEPIFENYIIVWGAASVPIIATYLVCSNAQLVGKVSPVIARIFSPLVLVTLTLFVIGIFLTGKDPYNDRSFLLLFNVILVAVMAIILLNASEAFSANSYNVEKYILAGLAVVTIIVNCIALSAILFRITEWGITPNRLAVTGSNLLILTHLVIVTHRIFKSLRNRENFAFIERSITAFLPVYGFWALFVTFLFPIIFGFK